MKLINTDYFMNSLVSAGILQKRESEGMFNQDTFYRDLLT